MAKKEAKNYLKRLSKNGVGLSDLPDEVIENLDNHKTYDDHDCADIAFGLSNTMDIVSSAVNELSDREIKKMQPEITRVLVDAVNQISCWTSYNTSSTRNTNDFIRDIHYNKDKTPKEEILKRHESKFVTAKTGGVTPFDIE